MNSSSTAPPWKAWASCAAFKKDGTVTAGNASGINDGAAAVLMMSAAKAAELGLTPMVCVAGYAVGLRPEIMGMGPVSARKSPGQGWLGGGRPGSGGSQRSLCRASAGRDP